MFALEATCACPDVGAMKFAEMFASSDVAGIYKQIHRHHLRILTDWCVRSVVSAPEGTPGYRDLYWQPSSGTFEWNFPWSNSAERIEALLWAGEVLGNPSAISAARRYVDCMVGDVRGIARDTATDADGMVWYWRESDAYMTNYTMRVPPAFLEAGRYWKNAEFTEVAIEAGEALLRHQAASGIFQCGWHPVTHPDITPGTINSRIIYAAWALAELHLETKEPRWAKALERFLDAIFRLQNVDGSFPAEFSMTGKRTAQSASKGHFLSYALYGLSRAALAMPSIPQLRESAIACGNYCLRELLTLGGNIYGHLETKGGSEQHVWQALTPDFAAGYAWLYRLTGNIHYREAAEKTLIQAFLRQCGSFEGEKFQGAVPIWTSTDGELVPAFGGFYQFWILLAAKGLDETGTQSLAM